VREYTWNGGDVPHVAHVEPRCAHVEPRRAHVEPHRARVAHVEPVMCTPSEIVVLRFKLKESYENILDDGTRKEPSATKPQLFGAI
jgi:hypothetical protein